ncbi:COG3014 family protein [Vibrio sp. HN007]|uniref:COG3014 family protein n=1 Tax=Vibrio iocasae TaxID=3098914 RepID=UPI0035D4CDE2
MKKFFRLTLVASFTAAVTACSTLSAGNLFSHYSAQNGGVYQAVETGQYQKAEDLLPEYVAGDILDNLEKGRVTFLNQQFEPSQTYFELSEVAVRQQQDQAVISISETATDIGSLAVNDNLQNYVPADYELGFLHLYLGLNYLHKNSLEGALVEVRKANQVQERAKRTRESDLQSAAYDLQQNGMSANLGSVLSQYPDAGQKLQAVQNGYLLYLSALLYETANELNSAYVDYKRALAVLPDNDQVVEGTLRVARKIGMWEDLKQLEAQYGKPEALSAEQSRIIIIDEQGVVFARQGWKQSLPVSSSHGTSWYTLALPYYPNAVSEYYPSLRLDDRKVDNSLLVDVNLMASQDLTERMPTIVMRQALRVVAKEQLRREASGGNNGNGNSGAEDIGNILFNVWNVLTEQPDTRSWQTLPAQVYSSSYTVEAGQHMLSFNDEEYEVSVKAGRTALVWISRQGNNAVVWHKQLGAL